MFIFAGARRKLKWVNDAPGVSVCAVTESSNINANLYLVWLEWFIDQLSEASAQLLILEKALSYTSVAAIKYGLGATFTSLCCLRARLIFCNLWK